MKKDKIGTLLIKKNKMVGCFTFANNFVNLMMRNQRWIEFVFNVRAAIPSHKDVNVSVCFGNNCKIYCLLLTTNQPTKNKGIEIGSISNKIWITIIILKYKKLYKSIFISVFYHPILIIWIFIIIWISDHSHQYTVNK